MNLNILRGKEVIASIPGADKKPVTVKVVSIEPNGLWVEGDSLRVGVFGDSLANPAGEKPIFFVPFSAITALVGWIPSSR